MSEVVSFDHVDLTSIDPSFQAVDQKVYTLQVSKAEHRTYENDKGSGEFVSLTFTIVDDEQYSGRKIFETLFPNKFSLIALRKLMDATGIAQESGEGLIDWLGRLAAEKPLVKYLVEKVPDVYRDGTPNPKTAKLDENGNPVAVPKNQINWREVQPA